MALEVLPPEDWKQLAKAFLSGRDYLLWETEFAKQGQATVKRNRTQQVPIFYEMLVGEGPYRGADQHLNIDVAAYVQIIQLPKRPEINFHLLKSRLRTCLIKTGT